MSFRGLYPANDADTVHSQRMESSRLLCGSTSAAQRTNVSRLPGGISG